MDQPDLPGLLRGMYLGQPTAAPTRIHPEPADALGVSGAELKPSVDGDGLAVGMIVNDTVSYIRRYVVLTDPQALACALWAVHTHAIDAAEATPYLNISSAEKQSGKTRLLETLETLVARPWLTGRTSVAALVRKIAKDRSTLLLDETDAAFSGDKVYSECLRSILNSGYKQNGVSTLCIGQGSNQEAKDYPVFGPKAFAGIGDRMPDTVKDRSIPVRLKRRNRGTERVQKFRNREARVDADKLRAHMHSWASTNVGALRGSRPSFPDDVSDRAEEVWEPLLAIADAAGGELPDRARSAMADLCSSDDSEDDSTGVRLLEDARAIFHEIGREDPTVDRIASVDLVRRLVEREESPWSEWAKGKPITTRGVAAILKQYGIKPGSQRLGDDVFKGYRAEQFTETFSRYLSQSVDLSVTTVTSLIPQGFASNSASVTDPVVTPSKNGAKRRLTKVVTDVTDEKPIAEKSSAGEPSVDTYGSLSDQLRAGDFSGAVDTLDESIEDGLRDRRSPS